MDDLKHRDSRFFAILAIFFGLGFVLGFLACFGYLRTETRVEVVEIFRDYPEPPKNAGGAPDARTASGDGAFSALPTEDPADTKTLTGNIELLLEEHFLGSDDGGTYIGGIVANVSDHPFDAVRVEFDLNDEDRETFGSVTETMRERIEPGDRWEFTIYIPYSDMERFTGYRLRSIMGVTR